MDSANRRVLIDILTVKWENSQFSICRSGHEMQCPSQTLLNNVNVLDTLLVTEKYDNTRLISSVGVDSTHCQIWRDLYQRKLPYNTCNKSANAHARFCKILTKVFNYGIVWRKEVRYEKPLMLAWRSKITVLGGNCCTLNLRQPYTGRKFSGQNKNKIPTLPFMGKQSHNFNYSQ